MPSLNSRSALAALWRGAKVVFAAWGITVACVIVTTVSAHIVLGPLAAEWLLDHRAYATALFFILGAIIAARWLK